MLCTQASLGLPFEIIQNSLEENIYLGESCKKNYSEPLKIFIKNKNNSISIKIKKILKIFKIYKGDPMTICHIKVILYIDLSDNNLIMKILKKN